MSHILLLTDINFCITSTHYIVNIMSDRQQTAEDIECIVQPKDGKGGIYIGNLTAAMSICTIKSTFFRM
jgi:hypothetical protein